MNHKTSTTLQQEFQWLGNIINTRFQSYFQGGEMDIFDIERVRRLGKDSYYTQLVQQHQMSFMEEAVLLLALAPHVIPQILDVFFIKNKTYDRDFSEFGGITGTQHKGFLPTGETAAFILAGNDFNKRLEVQRLFNAEHFFAKEGILHLEHKNSNEPLLSGQLVLSKEFIHYFTEGHRITPNLVQIFQQND